MPTRKRYRPTAASPAGNGEGLTGGEDNMVSLPGALLAFDSVFRDHPRFPPRSIRPSPSRWCSESHATVAISDFQRTAPNPSRWRRFLIELRHSGRKKYNHFCDKSDFGFLQQERVGTSSQRAEDSPARGFGALAPIEHFFDSTSHPVCRLDCVPDRCRNLVTRPSSITATGRWRMISDSRFSLACLRVDAQEFIRH